MMLETKNQMGVWEDSLEEVMCIVCVLLHE